MKDAEWIAQLLEHGLLNPSFVPPPDIRQLRMLTRYRVQLMGDRTRETVRLELMLEDDQAVQHGVERAHGVHAVDDRRVDPCETDPLKIADLAKGMMRIKIPDLAQGGDRQFRRVPRDDGPGRSFACWSCSSGRSSSPTS